MGGLGGGGGGGGGLFNEFVTYCRYVVNESGLNRYLSGLGRAANAARGLATRIADSFRSSKIGTGISTMMKGITDGIKRGMAGPSDSMANFFKRTRESIKGIAKEAGSFSLFSRQSGSQNRLDLHGHDLNSDRMQRAMANGTLQSMQFRRIAPDMAQLRRMNPSLDPATYTKLFGTMSKAAAISTRAVKSISGGIGNALSGVSSRMGAVASSIGRARTEAGGLARNTRSAANGADQMGGIMGQMQPMVANIAAMFAALSFTRLYDIAQSMTDALGNLVGSAEKAREIQKSILDISKETNSEYQENTDIFSSLHRIQDKTKLGLEDELRLTKAISQAAAVGGGTVDGRRRAIAQLAKAFGMDQMNAVSLHSIERQAPGITMALAKGMHTSIGDLKKLSSEGKLTGSEVAKALLSQADSINEMSKKVRPSFATIGLQAKNIALGIIQDFDHAWHGISNGIQYVVDAMFWLEKKGRELFHALAKRMGSTEAAAKLIGVAVLALGGPMILTAVYRLTTAMWGLAFGANAAIWPFTLVAAAIASLVLIGEDMYVWANGGISMMGKWVGPYSEWKGAVDNVKQAINECWVEIKKLFSEQTNGEIDKTISKNKPWAKSFGEVLQTIITVTEKITELARALKELKEGHNEAAQKIMNNLSRDIVGVEKKESWMEGLDRYLSFGGSREDFDLFLKNGGTRMGLLRRNLMQFGDDDTPQDYIMQKTGKNYDQLTGGSTMFGQYWKPNPHPEDTITDSGAVNTLLAGIQNAGETMRSIDARNAGALPAGQHLNGLGGNVGDVSINVSVDASGASRDSLDEMGQKVANGVRDGLSDHFPLLTMPTVERAPYNN